MKLSKQQQVDLITITRLLGIPFLFLINNRYLLFIYAGILFFTDYVDGQLARKWKVTSQRGALLDLIADKTLVLVLFLSAAMNGQIPYWVFYLIAFREITSMVLRQIKLKTKNKLIKANMIGKLKTTLQFIALGMMILNLPYYLEVVYVMLVISYISFIMYVYEFLNT